MSCFYMDTKMGCAATVLDIWSGSSVVGSQYLYALAYLVVWVEIFFLVWSRFPITVDRLLGNCFKLPLILGLDRIRNIIF